jgi:hypothetical protein
MTTVRMYWYSHRSHTVDLLVVDSICGTTRYLTDEVLVSVIGNQMASDFAPQRTELFYRIQTFLIMLFIEVRKSFNRLGHI